MTEARWPQCEKGRRGRERNGWREGTVHVNLYFIEFGKAVLCAYVLEVHFQVSYIMFHTCIDK